MEGLPLSPRLLSPALAGVTKQGEERKGARMGQEEMHRHYDHLSRKSDWNLKKLPELMNLIRLQDTR